MKTIPTIYKGLLAMACLATSQCTLPSHWSNRTTQGLGVQPGNFPAAPEPVTVALYKAPVVSRMPKVPPITGRLLKETRYTFNGRTFLSQQIVVMESPFETELRVIQIE